MLTVHQIINYPVSSNCFVLFDKAVGRDCIIVDPGGKSSDGIFSFLQDKYLIPQYIILTHEHFDHCWGCNEIVSKYHIPIICSELCAEWIKSYKKNCSVFYDNAIAFTIESKTVSVESLGFELDFQGTTIHFRNTPGHSDASICFFIENSLFTGDTVIKDVKTVTKLRSGSKEKLKDTLSYLESLKGKGFIVYPGHGEVFLLDGYDMEKCVTGRTEMTL